MQDELFSTLGHARVVFEQEEAKVREIAKNIGKPNVTPEYYKEARAYMRGMVEGWNMAAYEVEESGGIYGPLIDVHERENPKFPDFPFLYIDKFEWL